LQQVIEKDSAGGKEREVIEPQDAVLINFEGRIAEDTSVTGGSVFQEAQGWLVVVGDGDIIPALEMGVRFMETGQTALIWSHSKFALGPGTRSFQGTTVPPKSNVMYTVKVVQKVMDTSRLNPYFTIQKALTKKKIANDIYQYEWCPPPKAPDDPSCEQSMGRAIRLYTKTAKEMQTLLDGTYFQQVETDHPQRKESQTILLDSLNNITAVYLRQKDYNKAKLAAVNVLQVDPSNIKALMRAAKAALLDPASTMEEASEALKAAESEITYKNPNDEKELKRLKLQLKRKQQEYRQKTKEMFGNILARDDVKENKTSLHKEPIAEQDSDCLKDQPPSADSAKEDDTGEETTVTTKEQDASFWTTQVYVILFQIVVPLLIAVLCLRTFGPVKVEMGGVGDTEDERHAGSQNA
jgi:FKBP-type peptidyl-prolyl cis-trans isomerase